MPALAPLKAVIRKLGWVERAFIAAVILYLTLLLAVPRTGWAALAQFIAFVLGIWMVARVLRVAMRHAIWRLRNRLIVTYLFIGGVPILLIAALVGFSVYGLAGQSAAYFVTSELDSRVEALRDAARGVAETGNANRLDAMRRMSEVVYKDRLPGIMMLMRTPTGIMRYPPGAAIEPPRPGTGELSGSSNAARPSLPGHTGHSPGGDVTVLAPAGPEELCAWFPVSAPHNSSTDSPLIPVIQRSSWATSSSRPRIRHR